MIIFSISAEDQRTILRADARSFSAFIACPFKAYLEANGGSPSDANAIEHDLCKEYLEYRTAAIQQWIAEGENLCYSTVASRSNRLKASVCAAVTDTTAPLIDEPATLLVRIDAVKKPNGNRKENLYVPLGFSPDPKISRREKMRVAFTSMILSVVGYKTSPYGWVVAGDSFSIRRIELTKPKRQAAEALQQLVPIVNERQKPLFRLNSYCGVCCFSEDCRRNALEKDDLSLMGTLSSREIANLNKRGIFTVTHLSKSFQNRRRRRKRSRPEKHYPALRALAICENKIYVRDPPKLPETPTRIFLDVEGIPDRNFYYLVGAVVQTAHSVETHSFWADGPEDQETIWRDFLGLLRQYGTATIFHYGSYELQFIKRMNKRFPVKDAVDIEELLSSCTNVLNYFYFHIYFPTYTNSLKDIANYLGFTWRGPVRSGLMSIQFRKLWEATRESSTKQALIEYNKEDCAALQCLVSAIREICNRGTVAEREVASADVLSKSGTYGFGDPPRAIPDFEFINKCAYFDYQRTKIYWRTDKKIKRNKARRVPKVRARRINRTIRFYSRKCPKCGSTRISVNHRDCTKDEWDIVFGQTGARRRITRYIGHQYKCSSCGKSFYPRRFYGRHKYGHGVLAWVIYSKVGLRQTDESIRVCLNDLFGFSISSNPVWRIKARAVRYYSLAYNEIKHAIRSSRVVHVDETKVNIKGATGYVWVFATVEEALYVYSDTREGAIIPKVLKGFEGVLVSDFYSAYESMDCVQQRCLVHLIRDLNDDLVANPFDAEYKAFVEDFGKLLRSIVETIDRFGLKRRFLRKHLKQVRHFYCTHVEIVPESLITAKYVQRFKKNENWLFTFLDHDGVPWNNNNAENAIKAFAAMRKGVEAQFTAKGLRQILPMLSIAQTLRNKDASFLDFLKSGQISWKIFLGMR